jgi:hypothetical protein
MRSKELERLTLNKTGSTAAHLIGVLRSKRIGMDTTVRPAPLA